MFVTASDQDFVTRPGRRAEGGGAAGFTDLVSAGFTAESIETDRHAYMGRQIGDRYRGIWQRVVGAMGEDAAIQAFEDRGLRTSRLRGGRSLSQSFAGNPRHARALLEIARGLHTDLNEGTQAVPATPLDLVREVQEDVRAEWEDAMGTLNMGLGGAAVAEFLGRGAAAATDETSLLLAPLGAGGGSLARVALTEAALGALGEAAILPRMYEQASDLDLPEPQPFEQIAMGAVFGGALGTVGEALSRGVSYARLRAELDNVPAGLSVPEAQAAVEAAVEALEAGQPLPPIVREESPIIDVPMPDEADAAMVPDAAPRMPTQQELDDEIAQIRRDNPELQSQRPTLTGIRRAGGIQWTRIVEGERRRTPIAAELEGMGISQRQLLGAIRRDGMADIDNIVAQDFADGGTPRLATDDTGTYLNRNALLEAIADEVGGTPRYRTNEAEVAAGRIRDLEDEFAAIRRDLDGLAAAEGVRDFGGVYVDPPRAGEDNMDVAIRAEEGVLQYSDSLDAPLPSRIQYRAMAYLGDSGGSVEDAVMRSWMDEIEEVSDGNARSLEARAAEAVAEDDPNAQSGPADRSQAADARVDQALAAGRVEATPEGDQILTPGTEPITPRERLEAQQNAPMRGADAVANDGLFDLNARLQRDMFDDPDNAQMQAKYDEREAEMREAFEGLEDVEVELEGETITARQLLSDLEGDRAHLQAIETCGWSGRGGLDVVS